MSSKYFNCCSCYCCCCRCSICFFYISFAREFATFLKKSEGSVGRKRRFKRIHVASADSSSDESVDAAESAKISSPVARGDTSDVHAEIHENSSSSGVDEMEENEKRGERFAFFDDSDDDGVNVNNATLEHFNGSEFLIFIFFHFTFFLSDV